VVADEGEMTPTPHVEVATGGKATPGSYRNNHRDAIQIPDVGIFFLRDFQRMIRLGTPLHVLHVGRTESTQAEG
jgi:hypothetical protein